jgi:hypothetical protein
MQSQRGRPDGAANSVTPPSTANQHQDQAILRVLQMQLQQSMADCEAMNTGNSSLDRLRAAERIQLCWRRLRREDRRVSSKLRRQEEDAELLGALGSTESSPAPIPRNPSTGHIDDSVMSVDSFGNSLSPEAAIVAARTIQSLWKRRQEQRRQAKSNRILAAQRIQRLWRQYREAITTYEENLSSGSPERVAEEAQKVEATWKVYRNELDKTSRSLDGALGPADPSMSTEGSVPPVATAAPGVDDESFREAAARIQVAWRCYRAALVAATVVDSSTNNQEERHSAAQIIQESWRNYQAAVRHSNTIGGGNPSAAGASLSGGMTGDGTPAPSGGAQVDDDANLGYDEEAEGLDQDALDEDQDSSSSVGSDEGDALSLILAAASVTGMGPASSRSVTPGAKTVSDRVSVTRDHGTRSPSPAHDAEELVRSFTDSMGQLLDPLTADEAARIIQRVWRHRQQAESDQPGATGTTPSQGAGNQNERHDPDAETVHEALLHGAPYPENLISAVRLFQMRFRLSRIREQVHERDRAAAARRVQETWRKHRVVQNYRTRLEQGKREAAARAIQRFLRTTKQLQSTHEGVGDDRIVHHHDVEGHIRQCRNVGCQTALSTVGQVEVPRPHDRHVDAASAVAMQRPDPLTRPMDGPVCIICLEAPVQAAILPCGHAQTCFSCCSRLRRCCTCRCVIALRIRIYL